MNTALRGMATALRSGYPCFVTGTPVWTDKGLVPIEKIQVGDMVLSKSEVTGEKAYKRVVRTLRKEDQEIRTVCADGAMNEDGSELLVEFLFATPEHPFWIDTHGWMTVDELRDCGARYKIDTWAIERADGRKAMFFDEYEAMGAPVLHKSDSVFVCIGSNSAISDGVVGYTMCFDGRTQSDSFDPFVDVKRSASSIRIAFQGATFTGDDLIALNHIKGPPSTELRATVLNIEVEDFHTYFVGELGLWVHNNCNPIKKGPDAQPINAQDIAR